MQSESKLELLIGLRSGENESIVSVPIDRGDINSDSLWMRVLKPSLAAAQSSHFNPRNVFRSNSLKGN